jgi:hypothetical protein
MVDRSRVAEFTGSCACLRQAPQHLEIPRVQVDAFLIGSVSMMSGVWVCLIDEKVLWIS